MLVQKENNPQHKHTHTHAQNNMEFLTRKKIQRLFLFWCIFEAKIIQVIFVCPAEKGVKKYPLSYTPSGFSR